MVLSAEHFNAMVVAVAEQLPQAVREAGWESGVMKIVNSVNYTAPEALPFRYLEFAELCTQYFDHAAPCATEKLRRT